MNLVADEGVDRSVVERRLRQDGHDVVYVTELSPRVADEEVLRQANARSSVRLTAGKDSANSKPGSVIITGSTLHKFRGIMRPEDRVATYDPVRREYIRGTIKSDYAYKIGAIPDYPHVREVQWAGRVSRDVLSSTSRNTLGSFVTLFEPGDEVLTELETRLGTRSADSFRLQASGGRETRRTRGTRSVVRCRYRRSARELPGQRGHAFWSKGEEALLDQDRTTYRGRGRALH